MHEDTELNFEGSKPGAYCKVHAKSSMVNLGEKRCSHDYCIKVALLKFKGNKTRAYRKHHHENCIVGVHKWRSTHGFCTRFPASFSRESNQRSASNIPRTAWLMYSVDVAGMTLARRDPCLISRAARRCTAGNMLRTVCWMSAIDAALMTLAQRYRSETSREVRRCIARNMLTRAWRMSSVHGAYVTFAEDSEHSLRGKGAGGVLLSTYCGGHGERKEQSVFTCLLHEGIALQFRGQQDGSVLQIAC